MASSTIPNDVEPTKPFILINVNNVEKLVGPNYRQWQAQLSSLLLGFGLHQFIDGTSICPPPTLTVDKETTRNPTYSTWFRQDRLLYGALTGTLAPIVAPLVTRASSSKEAWDILANTYALPSRGHIKQLKLKLKNLNKGTLSISAYMQQIKTITDELAILGAALSSEDLTDKITDGLPSDYHTVIAALDARDTPIDFPELHEKLINRELIINSSTPSLDSSFPAVANPTYSRSQHHLPHHRNRFPPKSHQSPAQPNQNPSNPFKGRCQWCNAQGHTLGFCNVFKSLYPDIRVPRHPRNPPPTAQVHTSSLVPTESPANSTPWLLDSGASHHVTADILNLSLHYPYDGTDEIVIGDGTGLSITHFVSLTLCTSPTSLTLSRVLDVPSMKKNIISVSQFCAENNVLIDFSPHAFFVKASSTGKTLLTGLARDGVYCWSRCPPQ